MKSSITEVLEIMNISSTDAQTESLCQYSDMVLEWNSRVNITGAADVAAFIEGPLFDALTLVPVFEPGATLVDIGSGGGLPAVPLAILYPEVCITMVEPRGRRASFLNELISVLHLNATVYQTQDRELTRRDFDGASAQAVFPAKKWISRARQLVHDRGAIYTLTSEEILESMLPNRVHIEYQKKYRRDHRVRYATRLRKTDK
ncbi:MAG: 16S rRNA (guanine(527)-N(7))-methyltransferase RsmG [Deltaproteobacteria bacterium]|nr:16S rRNA (guanine(527)-N(7))-methyltransferase RsmG [Deltaproteobacteria bacterium]